MLFRLIETIPKTLTVIIVHTGIPGYTRLCFRKKGKFCVTNRLFKLLDNINTKLYDVLFSAITLGCIVLIILGFAIRGTPPERIYRI